MSDEHESPIKTPKQLITVIVLSFTIPIALVGFLVAYVTGGLKSDVQASKPEAVAERIKPVGMIGAVKDPSAPKVFQTGEQVYKAVCAACHATGAAGAFKFGDKAAWAPHIKEGVEALTANAIKGIRAMPAKGGNPDLDNFEVARAVVYMTNASGANFKEPVAPAAPAASATAKPADAKAAAAAPAVVIPPPMVAAAAPAAGKADVGQALYNQACQACHASGAANAPKLGDKAAWGPRLSAGVDTLTQSVIKGKGAMPPKGMAMSASDADIKAAVQYMVSSVK